METKTFKNWWLLTVNGLISAFVGLVMLLCTEAFVNAVIFYFAIILLASGAILLIASIYNIRKEKNVGMILLQSIAAVTIGLIMLLAPGDVVLHSFFLLIGVWAIVAGVFQLAVLVNAGKTLANKNIILINGLLTIALGVFLCLKPIVFATFVARLLGILAVLFGIIMIYLSFLVKKVHVIPGKEKEPHVL
jgi:uncharacterized membrane protein HdeD (DUF308 family)